MTKRIHIILSVMKAIKRKKSSPEGFTYLGRIKADGTIERADQKNLQLTFDLMKFNN